MTYSEVGEATPMIRNLLANWFEGHDIATRMVEDAVRFPAHPGLWVDGVLLRQAGQQPHVARFDLLLGLNDTQVICESVLGMGNTTLEKVSDAVRTVGDTSLHVLLSAFFGAEPCEHAVRQLMRIGGRDRVVHSGPVSSRMGLPTTASGEGDISFLEEFQRQLVAYPLSAGTHWARLYLFRGADKYPPTTEVLLDNEACPELQRGMGALFSPPPPNTFDVRVFIVIQDAPAS